MGKKKMMKAEKQPVRTGVTPVERPTEWTTAVVMLATAFFAWQADRNFAAFLAVAAAALPTLVTAIATWWERRHTESVGVVPMGEQGE